MTNWIPPVPTADSANNNTMNDVIGSKLDTPDGDSIYAKAYTILCHLLTASHVYPTLANGVAVLSGAAWVLGNFVEIVPINTIASRFCIHFISVEALTANDVYELVLYTGADVELCRARFTKNAVQDGTVNVPVRTTIIPANTQIKAKLATSTGADTSTISIMYHAE